MKMTVGADLPPDYSPSHEDLSQASCTLIAHALLPLFAENMPEPHARANAQGVLTELAYLLDEGEITMGGKTYHLRLAFVNEDGAALPGFEAMDRLAEMTEDAFAIDPEMKISFEEPDYEE